MSADDLNLYVCRAYLPDSKYGQQAKGTGKGRSIIPQRLELALH